MVVLRRGAVYAGSWLRSIEIRCVAGGAFLVRSTWMWVIILVISFLVPLVVSVVPVVVPVLSSRVCSRG